MQPYKFPRLTLPKMLRDRRDEGIKQMKQKKKKARPYNLTFPC